MLSSQALKSSHHSILSLWWTGQRNHTQQSPDRFAHSSLQSVPSSRSANSYLACPLSCTRQFAHFSQHEAGHPYVDEASSRVHTLAYVSCTRTLAFSTSWLGLYDLTLHAASDSRTGNSESARQLRGRGRTLRGPQASRSRGPCCASSGTPSSCRMDSSEIVNATKLVVRYM